MSKLTRSYIAERRAGVHTPESFGRTFIERALAAAEAKIGQGEADSVVLDDVSVSVWPFESPKGLFCVKIKVTIGGIEVEIHVGR